MTIIAAAPLSMGLLTRNGPPDWHPATRAIKDACKEAACICDAHNVDIADTIPSLKYRHTQCRCHESQ